MNLSQWCNIDESIYIADSDERYKQYAGLEYNENLIKSLANMRLSNAQIFLDTFSKPRELYLSSLESVADSKTKELELQLHRLRNEKIISKQKFGNSQVNWSTWRQYNNREKDPQKRKRVYDEFIVKTRYIAPLIQERFSIIRDIYNQYGQSNLKSKKKFSPLDGYLESEKFSHSKLEDFVRSMGNRAKKPFREALEELSNKVLKRRPEYYDDFYFFRNIIYSDLEKHFKKIDPIDSVNRTLKYMQFDTSKINFDTQSRPAKYPSPICFFVKIPDDIRVLYKSESPYFDLQGCYHETGHAIHASSIDPGLEYWSKYGFSMGIAEIFSIFLERLTRNSTYLATEIGINDDRILSEIKARNNFMELFFITFYSANSLMKMEYWDKKLSTDKANARYSSLIKEFTGFEIPGQYWMLHHILPEAIMYVPSYIMAAVRASELENYLESKFGDKWWKHSDAGELLREVMKDGAKIDLGTFSKFDSRIYLREITDV